MLHFISGISTTPSDPEFLAAARTKTKACRYPDTATMQTSIYTVNQKINQQQL